MAGASLKPVEETDGAVSEPHDFDPEALGEENKQLRELVIQLSKLVIKYVVDQR